MSSSENNFTYKNTSNITIRVINLKGTKGES